MSAARGRGRTGHYSRQIADPYCRGHPFPAEVHLRRHRRRMFWGAGQPRKHQGVRRSGQGSRESCCSSGIPIRIGVNAGSLDKRLLRKYAKPTAEALVESALWEAGLFEEHGFGDIKISVKHSDPVVMVNAYRSLAAQCDYPLHLGVTEARPAFQGTIKSAVAFAHSARASATQSAFRSRPRLSRKSRSARNPAIAGHTARQIRDRLLPSCGRAQVDVYRLANEVTAGLEGIDIRFESRSSDASSMDRARRVKPISGWLPVMAKARSSSRAR